MSFFKKAPAPAPQRPSDAQSYSPPKQGNTRGDRMAPVRMDAPDVPHHRAQGLTARVVLPEKLPRGLLFKVGVGYFDLDGYWCVPKANGLIEVRRGAPRAVNKHMTAIQRHELARVRLNARRSQLR